MRIKSSLNLNRYPDILNWIREFNDWILNNNLESNKFQFEISNSNMSVAGIKFILKYDIKNISVAYEVDVIETLSAVIKFNTQYVDGFKTQVLQE